MPGRRSRFFLHVAAELETHGGEHLGGKFVFTTRSEALIKRRAEYGGGSAGLDGGEDGPAAFAGIRDASGKALESGLIEERNRGQVEQPGSDDAAAAPDFG